VDVVDICLPTYLHAENAVKAMEKGRDVFIEKPVCMKLEEAERLLEVQRRTGSKVQVGQVIRFWTEYVYLKELIDSNKYGKITSAVFKRVSPRPGWAWDNWINEENRSGSAALDLHVHDVDYVRYILGEPDTIKSSVVKTGENSEHIFSIYKYGDISVLLEGGWDYPENFPFEMEYRVRFEQATAVFSTVESPSLKIYKVNGETEVPEFKEEITASGDSGGNISSLGGYYNELRYFVDCLVNGKDIKVASLEEAVKSLKLILREIAASRE
jgi:predicted dehydrogenase